MQAVLEFLAILGDPIASLPNVTELEIIQHWYETRLNSNTYYTPERNGLAIYIFDRKITIYLSY